MKSPEQAEKIRWQVIKSMLDEFPALKKKVKNYLEKEQSYKG
jgi:hypothetical protein